MSTPSVNLQESTYSAIHHKQRLGMLSVKVTAIRRFIIDEIHVRELHEIIVGLELCLTRIKLLNK